MGAHRNSDTEKGILLVGLGGLSKSLRLLGSCRKPKVTRWFDDQHLNIVVKNQVSSASAGVAPCRHACPQFLYGAKPTPLPHIRGLRLHQPPLHFLITHHDHKMAISSGFDFSVPGGDSECLNSPVALSLAVPQRGRKVMEASPAT